MSLTNRHQLPRIIEIGVNTTITLDVYDADSQQQTIDAGGTVAVALGNEVLVSGLSVSAGPPATASLSSSLTTGRAPSDGYLETWSVEIGGEPHTFRRSGYLVRCAFHPTIVDQDLIDRDSDILEILDSTTGNLSQWREQARKRLERDLLRKGRRPWLIFDSYELVDAHIALSMYFIYRDTYAKISESRYQTLYKEAYTEYTAALGSASFRYDQNQDGVMSETDPLPLEPPLTTGAGPRNGRRSSWYGWGY